MPNNDLKRVNDETVKERLDCPRCKSTHVNILMLKPYIICPICSFRFEDDWESQLPKKSTSFTLKLIFYDASKRLPFDHIDDDYPANDFLVMSDIGGLWRLCWDNSKKKFESRDPEQKIDMNCVKAWARLDIPWAHKRWPTEVEERRKRNAE